jgi:hypothetical protein
VRSSPKLYRVADASILEDEAASAESEGHRHELIELFLEALQISHRLDPDLSRLLESSLPLGMLCDIIAHALEISPSVKQILLDEPQVDRRIATILSVLRKTLAQSASSRPFPPPFSLN